MRLGFRGRLVLGTTLLVVLFVATAVAVLAVSADHFATEQVAREIDEGQASFQAQMEQRRAALRDKTRFLSRSSLLLATAEIPDVDQATFEDAFDEIQGAFATPLVAVLDATGRITACRGGRWRPGQDLQTMPGLQAALRGEVSDHVWPLGDGLLLIGLAPLIRNDQLLGVLVRGEPLDDGLAAQIGAITGRDLVLVHDGAILAERWLGEGPQHVEHGPLLQLRHAQLDDHGTALSLAIDGSERQGLAVRIHADAGIAFLAHEPTAILQLLAQARRWLIVVGLVLALLGVAFATRMAARLARPLRQLIDASNRIGSGELSARVGATEDDELGRLAQSFNAMAQTMQQLIADVTDKAARAEAANRSKDGFLTSMSHELRTPLTGIQSTAELLQQFGDQASPEERAEFLATILREAERLGRRISDSLDFANLSGGKARWTLGRVDLQRVCEQACRRLHSLQALKAVVFAITGEPEPVFQGDREHVTQAVYHLLHNAWTWSPAGETVDVTVGSVDGGFVVEVKDRGPGIPEHEREAIFDYFTQGGSVLVDKPQGIGIGLKIATEVAQVHGGCVEYGVRPGGGAVFRLLLRRADRPIDRLAVPVEADGAAAVAAG